MTRLLLVAALAALAPLAALAESSFTSTTGSGGLSTSAKLDFTITVPKVLFLQVGTGGPGFTGNAAVDNIAFDVPAGSVGTGTTVSGTNGDQTNGAVTIRVLGNSGTVTLNNAVTGPISDGGAITVPWSQIAVASAPLGSTTPGFDNFSGIAHPLFSASSGNGTATTLAATGGLVRREGKWTFSYLNGATLPSGTYGGSANGGRVIYTATAP
ncbi:hypothetical protein GCM10023165_43790 [Variovorax defluvii]|uniref:WxL domain-containing protein n=1 Tax=Variovorax defluvii TaxID=913761 RepID=A0ABP8I8B3_9BURK